MDTVVVRYRPSGRTASEIAASLESAVASGHYAAGDRLPTVRLLADQLGVNPNTVSAAYRSLRDRGVIETSGRRGTRVRQRPAVAPRAAVRVTVPPGARDVSTGNPAPVLLPRLDGVLRRYRSAPVGYDDVDLTPALATAASTHLAETGVPTGFLAVTSGALDAIERVLGAHLRPGDTVAVEDPGWGSLLDLVAAMGFVAVGVDVDDEGPVPSSLDRALDGGARALVVTSRAQNPTGAAVSASRARAVRRSLRERPGVLVVEDDHAAEVAGAPISSLVSPTPVTSRWAHVRSLSKSYGPDLRVAVVAGDESTIARVRGRFRLGPGWVSHLLQHVAAGMWTEPELQSRVARAATRYAARRNALVAALAREGVTAHGHSGLNVWVPVPDETTAVTSLLASGWAVAPGARFRISSPPGVRVTITQLAAGDVQPLARAVVKAVTTRARPGA